MFIKNIDSSNQEFAMYITIKCSGKRAFRCMASEYGRQNSKYADRTINVDGVRLFYFSFPVSTKAITLTIYNRANKEDKDFTVDIEFKPLKKYQTWLDEDSREFLPLALMFCQTCGFTNPSSEGKKYSAAQGKFNIKYFPVIKDYMTGMAMSTPARIGHTSGIIEVSKAKFDCYTIPMRMIILLHEFSHKYRNPKVGLPISNETGADVNALYIYLGIGFSKIDAIYVFANVFLKAQTQQNIERMRKIMDYIQRFENQEEVRLA